MGFLDKLASAAGTLGNELEKKQVSIENRARSEIRSKARHATDEELRHNLQRARDNNNYIMEEEIEREMERRGIF